MKKLAPVLFLAVLLAPATLFSDEKTIVWERIYQNALNDQMRYEVMLNIRDLNDPAFSPLLNTALTDLVSRNIELGTTNEVSAKVMLATQIIQELGELKDGSGADQIYQVFKEIKNYPFLRSEAAMALGKTRSVEYAGDLAKSLENLNFFPSRDNATAQEILAFGLVQTMALMKDGRGFEPTFFASIGWYSAARKVKETAKAMLKLIVDDPTDSLNQIVAVNPDLVLKLRALEAEEESKADPAQKAKVALTALEVGTTLSPKTITEGTQLADIRKKAMEMLVSNKDHSPAGAVLLQKAYETGMNPGGGLAKDTGEILNAILGSGVNGTPEALSFLVERMTFFNARANTPGLMTDFDNMQVRQLLSAFKYANSQSARPVLMEAQFLYTPAVQKLVKEVLAGLPK